MGKTHRLSVVIACHNRKRLTIRCLSSLFSQNLGNDVELDIYIVDDGSTDGTATVVHELFPEVKIISGDGNWYWCKSMRIGIAEALKSTPKPKSVLLLNDDVELFPNAIETAWRKQTNVMKDGDRSKMLIAGATKDISTGRTSYGLRHRGLMVDPNGHWQFLNNSFEINGNFLLISDTIFDTVGNLSRRFSHSMGDSEFGYRCASNGIGACLAPEYVGFCDLNRPPYWKDPEIPMLRRLYLLHTKKGNPPWEYLFLAKQRLPYAWPLSLVKLYLIAINPNRFS